MDYRQQQIQNDAIGDQSIVGKAFFMKSDNGKSFRLFISEEIHLQNLQSLFQIR